MEIKEKLALNECYWFRNDIVASLKRDLIGPYFEDEEIVNEDPVGYYISGILYPRDMGNPAPEEDKEGECSTGSDDDEEELSIGFANKVCPSSMGISFAIDLDKGEEFQVTIESAYYLLKKMGSPTGGRDDEHWYRKPISADPITIRCDKPHIGSLPINHDGAPVNGLELFYRVGKQSNGSAPITLALNNKNRIDLKERNTSRKSELSFFQSRITVESDAEGGLFVDRHLQKTGESDDDARSNLLLYRHVRDFAIGHGCSANWDLAKNGERAIKVRTEYIPTYPMLLHYSNPEIPDDKLTMHFLSSGERRGVVMALKSLTENYHRWIGQRKAELPDLRAHGEAMVRTGVRHIDSCLASLRRIESGIEILEENDHAWEAFQLMNRAMMMQMSWGKKRKSANPSLEVDETAFKWYPFQIAFILQCLRGMVEPESDDRKIADLLWFPTGGGKTEAYLGLIAFTAFIRRLEGRGAGVAAIMRYTLRLLTIQQFQRAVSVICACELIRRELPDRYGDDPISVGLWVGDSTTPNSMGKARDVLRDYCNGTEPEDSNPIQLLYCPKCGAPLNATGDDATNNYRIVANRKDSSSQHLSISCSTPGCPFKGEGNEIPAYVIDEDLYSFQPTLVIATVDKYAQMAWEGKVANLFLDDPDAPNGAANPPELIVQDELHLISGPLGTMTGLYEGAVDFTCTKGTVGPKIVASTATIRGASKQIRGLFNRETRQFPAPGLDVRDSFFAVEAPMDKKATRLYVGACAPGMTHSKLLARSYASLLQTVYERDDMKDGVRDPYWTLIGYFNSLRVLGSALAQIDDEVPSTIHNFSMRHTPGAAQVNWRKVGMKEELNSNVKSSKIPGIVKQLETPIGSRDEEPLDVVFATNMIAVGMDVDRLGLMVVMGQPPSTAEYIQSTSRVGRQKPGLVVTLYNDAKARDRSYYESFRPYHSSIYRHVEATGVTPFSSKARERGIHATIVSMCRLNIPALRGNDAAGNIIDHSEEAYGLVDWLVSRVQEVSPPNAEGARDDANDFLAFWIDRASETRRQGGQLYYRSGKKDPKIRVLLRANDGSEGDAEEGIPTMLSLRDVDKVSHLFLKED